MELFNQTFLVVGLTNPSGKYIKFTYSSRFAFPLTELSFLSNTHLEKEKKHYLNY